MKIHHTGIAVKNLEKALETFIKTHEVTFISDKVYDKEQDAELVYVKTSTGLDFEFVSGPQVENLIAKGITYYHVCYEVEDIEKSIKNFQNSGAMIVSKLKPAILFDNRRVVFLYTSYGLVELLEETIS